ncbi:hypothetical protein [Actinocatenispora comari]|uniref:hypothetical protein n=1 Tax=Actinocatenispora comari TaxID=2807577 RepID=UPI001A9302FB|nr:hypothetical protein [Actinocatenispora comari]
MIALHWGYPSQEIWVREAGSWSCAIHPSTVDWEYLVDQDDELVLLIPADQDRYDAGWRDGRFDLLRSLDRTLRQLSDATHQHPK